MGGILRAVGKGSFIWLPYLILVLAIFLDVQISNSRLTASSGYFPLSLAGVPYLFALAGLAVLVVIQARLCLHKKHRSKSIFCLVFAVFVVMIFSFAIEKLMPPVFRYSDLQLSVQAQLERRLQSTTKVFCGVETKLETDYFGWADKPRRHRSARPRILFIGDSFLETLTAKPIAHRIEERISRAGTEIEVINMSQYNTGPDPEYRHRFHELAFDYDPKHIFIFLYSGNDLSTHYKYSPYRHSPFRITNESVDFLDDAGLEGALSDRVHEIRNSDRIFKSRLELYDTLQSVSPAVDQRALVYLAAVGFSQKHGPSISERIIPNTVIRFRNMRANISTTMKRTKRSRSASNFECECRPVDEIRDKYRSIFNLPPGGRLVSIAKFIARDYCEVDDHLPFLNVLEKQDPWFIDQIINEPDSLDAVALSVLKAVRGKSKRKKTKLRRVEAASSEYVKLLSDFQVVANSRGVGLTVVMIPVGTNIDDTFLRCWETLGGRGKGEGRGPLMVAALKDKLDGKMNVLDLTDYPEDFQEAHWIFDGHWNDHGSESAARILTEYITKLGVFPNNGEAVVSPDGRD